MEAPCIKKFCGQQSTDKHAVTSSIAKYFVKSMRPVSEIENEGFLELLIALSPAYHPPCRKTMRSRVMELCGKVETKMKDEVSAALYCGAQADIWSSRRMHGYFGMAVSYIISGKLNTRLVACRRFSGSHTGENIASLFVSLVEEFHLQNITTIVTDNAANIKKAFDNVHMTNVSEVDSDGNDDEGQMERNGVQWGEIEEEFPFDVPQRYSCVAHSLQLVVNDGLKEGTDKIKTLVGKCKKVVSSLHMSCKATELLEKEAGRHIPAANSTRWNSTYAMLEAIVKIEESKPGLLSRVAAETGSTCSTVRFTAMDHAVLAEMCKLLNPIADATTRLEAEGVPTSSMVIPVILGIQNKLANVSTTYCTSLKTGLIVSFDKRLGDIRQDPHFITSAVLDPRFKMKWITGTVEEAQVKAVMAAKIESVQENNETVAQTTQQQQQQPNTSSATGDDFFSFLDDNVHDVQDGDQNEFEAYLADTTPLSALEFWYNKKMTYPHLYKLHLQHHCVPATSAAMERHFSAAGYIINARRSSLADASFEAMLVARCNKDMLD